MTYKVMVKYIDVVNVNARSEDEAIELVKRGIDIKALTEITVCEEMIDSNTNEEK